MSKTIFEMYKEENKHLKEVNAELLEACKDVINIPQQFNIPVDLVNKITQAIAKAEEEK